MENKEPVKTTVPSTIRKVASIVPRQELTIREKEEVKKKARYKCIYCGCANRLILTVDHKTPLARGGSDEPKNLSCCCDICNNLKGGLNHEEFKNFYKILHDLKEMCKAKVLISGIEVEINPGQFPYLKKE